MTSAKAFRPPTPAADSAGLLGALKKIRSFDLPAFKRLVREVLTELLDDGAIDREPYAYGMQAALDAFPGVFSETVLRRRIRKNEIAVRYDGTKVVIIGASLRAYVDSLPAERKQALNSYSDLAS